MIGDIATGHSAGADVCWLIAVILAVLAAVAAWPTVPAHRAAGWAASLAYGAVAGLALGLLLL